MKRIFLLLSAMLAGVILTLLLATGRASAESDSDYLFDGEGTYYITGVQLGVSLTFREGPFIVSLSDGRLSDKQDCTRFRFEARGANMYVIRPDCSVNAYLTYGYSGQLVAERDTGILPAAALWRVIPQQGGAQLVNVANGQRLVSYGLEATLKPADEIGTAESGDTSLWLLIKTASYGTDGKCPVQELQVAEKTVEKAVTRSGKVGYCELFGFSWGPFSHPSDFTFSVDTPEVMTISKEGTIVVKTTGEAVISARHRYTGQKLTATLNVSNDAIVIVPGFMGSELKNKDGDKIWSESLLNSLSEGISLSALSKFLDLGSPSAKDGITAYDNSFGALDLYKQLYLTINKTFSKDYTVIFYAYDWRRSSGTTGAELAAFLEKKNFDNVIFVTHSFGGLVCGQALAASETLREHTELLCMIGVPVNGTAATAQAWAQDRFGNALGLGSFGSMENNAIRKIVCTLPSIYEMLPSPYAVEQLGLVGNCDSYSAFLSACEASCASFNRSLANDAAAVSAKLFIDGKSVFDLVPTVLFGGKGYDTAASATVSGGKLSFDYTTDGDGVVSQCDCTAGLTLPEGTEVTPVPAHHLWLAQEQVVIDGVKTAISNLSETKN